MNEHKPHITVIYDGVPNTETGGGAFCVFSITKSLKEMGNTVSAVLLLDKPSLEARREMLDTYRSLVDTVDIVVKDVAIKNIFSKIKEKLSLSMESIYPEFAYADTIKERVMRLGSDVVFVFHFQALAAAYKIVDIPKMTVVGDPPYEVMKYRFGFFLRQLDIRHILLLPFYPILYYKHKKYAELLLKSCNSAGAVAHQHAEELAQLSKRPCTYYPIPIIDLASGAPLVKKDFSSEGKKFKVLLLGHLKGIVAVTGIELFAEKILPILIDKIGEDKLEISIVGSHFESLPENLKHLLSKKCVTIKGHLKSIDEELTTAAVLLVPTPIRLGIRVRVITGMCYGSVMAVHSANCAGIPELQNGHNCLLGASGEELAQRIVECFEGRHNIEQIRSEARRTFDKFFESNVATKRIVDDLLCLTKNI